jgi:hypothetical protein
MGEVQGERRAVGPMSLAAAARRQTPQVQALRGTVAQESNVLAATVDRVACAPRLPAMRVAVLLDIAHRALQAAASLTATARVPETAVLAMSPRPDAARALLGAGKWWRQRCPECGRRYGRADRADRCVPGRCVPLTGWEQGNPDWFDLDEISDPGQVA